MSLFSCPTCWDYYCDCPEDERWPISSRRKDILDILDSIPSSGFEERTYRNYRDDNYNIMVRTS